MPGRSFAVPQLHARCAVVDEDHASGFERSLYTTQRLGLTTDRPRPAFHAPDGSDGYGPAPKAVSLKRDWLKSVYPAPVYVATFADLTTVRMSFWNRIGKPWDVDRGRALCASWHQTMTGLDLDMIAGHVEVWRDDTGHRDQARSQPRHHQTA